MRSDASEAALAAKLATFKAPLMELSLRLQQCLDGAHADAANIVVFFTLLPSIFGDAVGAVVTQALTESCVLEAVCAADRAVPGYLQRLLHEMHFAYLPCVAFKVALAKALCHCYLAIMRDPGSGNKDSLIEFSVQLFTNPTVSMACVKVTSLRVSGRACSQAVSQRRRTSCKSLPTL